MRETPVVRQVAHAEQQQPAQPGNADISSGAADDDIGEDDRQTRQNSRKDARGDENLLVGMSQGKDQFPKPEHCILRQVGVVEVDLAELPFTMHRLDRTDNDLIRMPDGRRTPCDAGQCHCKEYKK
jgi:hypothetical protein